MVFASVAGMKCAVATVSDDKQSKPELSLPGTRLSLSPYPQHLRPGSGYVSGAQLTAVSGTSFALVSAGHYRRPMRRHLIGFLWSSLLLLVSADPPFLFPHGYFDSAKLKPFDAIYLNLMAQSNLEYGGITLEVSDFRFEKVRLVLNNHHCSLGRIPRKLLKNC